MQNGVLHTCKEAGGFLQKCERKGKRLSGYALRSNQRGATPPEKNHANRDEEDKSINHKPALIYPLHPLYPCE
jgi:hypothetical protein